MAPFLSLFVACAWHGPVPIAAADGSTPSPLVVAMDRQAYDHVVLVSQASRVLDDGRVEISVQLQNRDATELPVHFDVQFHTPAADDALPGTPDAVETSWHALQIAGSGSSTLTATSQAAGPRSYSVELWVP